MILNVIDDRRTRYRWKQVTAIAEPTWHDNKCKDSDRADPTAGESEYEEINNISVNEAIKWASELPFNVTLYLSDANEAGTSITLSSDPTD